MGMKKLYKLLLIGHTTILVNMLTAIAMTICYDFLVKQFGHAERFAWIFGLGGCVMAFASLGVAVLVWTNKLGDGFPEESNKEQTDFGPTGYGPEYK